LRKVSFRIEDQDWKMLETSARLLRLLSLLQMPRDWTGPQLAERLGVTTRTVRNDVERLRSLGYPVHATPGVAGGYRLGAGSTMPPLLLEDDEAAAVAVGLRTVTAAGVAGVEEASLRALAKLEQVLPSRVRNRVSALHSFTVPLPGTGPAVDADVLSALAAACRDHQGVRFDYTMVNGRELVREVEPHRLAHTRGRWYLLAWDLGRGDWRTFRADRIRLRSPGGRRFSPRPLPAEDVASYIAAGLGSAMWRYRARVTVHAPADRIAGRVPAAIEVTPLDGHRCQITVGSDTVGMLAAYLGMLDADFEVHEPGELVDHVRALAGRYQRAARSAAS
jgi:predicted DNA-binding transcriptional regulator YafY